MNRRAVTTNQRFHLIRSHRTLLCPPSIGTRLTHYSARHERPGMAAFFRSTRSTRTAAALFVGMAAIGMLSACGSSDPGPNPTHSATASPQPTQAETPSATPTPSDPPTPVALTCEQIVTVQQLYAFNPNYGVNPDYQPKDGSAAAHAVADKGKACSWLNQTSRHSVDVSVSKPSATALDALKSTAATSSTVVPTYGVPPEIEGYFSATDGTGEAQIFTNGYWVVVSSVDFAEPGDPQPLVQSVVSNLPKK